MLERKNAVLPSGRKILGELGRNMKAARLRRDYTTEQVAERAGISRVTLWQIEKGSPAVALGHYLQVLLVLNLEKDLLKIAADDELGRKLQDAALFAGNKNGRRKRRESL
jgi:transcriptional regulator with XRE-family HTH domain